MATTKSTLTMNPFKENVAKCYVDEKFPLVQPGQKNHGTCGPERDYLKKSDFSVLKEYYPNIKTGEKVFSGKGVIM